MGDRDDAAADAIHALADDTAEAWEAFVRVASPAVWSASLRAAPRRSRAEALFTRMMACLHQERLALAPRLAASRLPNATVFLAREIDGQVGGWLVELFRAGAVPSAVRDPMLAFDAGNEPDADTTPATTLRAMEKKITIDLRIRAVRKPAETLAAPKSRGEKKWPATLYFTWR